MYIVLYKYVNAFTTASWKLKTINVSLETDINGFAATSSRFQTINNGFTPAFGSFQHNNGSVEKYVNGFTATSWRLL